MNYELHSVIDMLEQKRKLSRFLTHSRKQLSNSKVCAPYLVDMGQAKARKGARRMPVAREGDEGRGKLRKAPGRRKRSLIRRYPNGATRQSDGLSSAFIAEANLGN